MPKYFCFQRQEYVLICPLNLEFVYGRTDPRSKDSKCDKWFFDGRDEEYQAHLKEHGIADTEPIGSGIIL